MFPPDNINNLLKDIIARLNTDDPNNAPGKGGNKNAASSHKPCLSPSQVLVIAGILGGVLSVDSVLVDRDQNVEIVLVGTLRQKTELDLILGQVGSMPVDEVLNALVRRFLT